MQQINKSTSEAIQQFNNLVPMAPAKDQRPAASLRKQKTASKQISAIDSYIKY